MVSSSITIWRKLKSTIYTKRDSNGIGQTSLGSVGSCDPIPDRIGSSLGDPDPISILPSMVPVRRPPGVGLRWDSHRAQHPGGILTGPQPMWAVPVGPAHPLEVPTERGSRWDPQLERQHRGLI
ncbi:hypothetical protein Taro_040362, partial [Colocasia esculenta]|nr:hypothetical protein [Colocasia esculenta]